MNEKTSSINSNNVNISHNVGAEKENTFVIIGAGWYGCHLALTLKQKGFKVILLEQNSEIFRGISGTCGIRLHAGPHYPNSPETRLNCQSEFERFKHTYGDLILEHLYAIYALMEYDSNGQISKVDKDLFSKVCRERHDLFNPHEFDPTEYGFSNLITAFNLNEPSIVIGNRLRDYFKKRLQEEGIPVYTDQAVNYIKKLENEDTVLVGGNGFQHTGDYVINATSFKSLLPDTPLPSNIECVYQPCLTLIYKHKTPIKPEELKTHRPSSMICMDGSGPCMMPHGDPVLEADDNYYQYYIVTHATGTIMNSNKTVEEADKYLYAITDHFIETEIKIFCENDIARYTPKFKEDFEYKGWAGVTLAKPITRTEFRSAITYYQQKLRMFGYVPGKVGDIFQVEDEILAFLEHPEKIIGDSIQYTKDGVLDRSIAERSQELNHGQFNTCLLDTWTEKLNKLIAEQNRVSAMALNTQTETSNAENPSEQRNSEEQSRVKEVSTKPNFFSSTRKLETSQDKIKQTTGFLFYAPGEKSVSPWSNKFSDLIDSDASSATEEPEIPDYSDLSSPLSSSPSTTG